MGRATREKLKAQALHRQYLLEQAQAAQTNLGEPVSARPTKARGKEAMLNTKIGLALLVGVFGSFWLIVQLARNADPVGLGILIFIGVVILTPVVAISIAIARGGWRRGQVVENNDRMARAFTDLSRVTMQMARTMPDFVLPAGETKALPAPGVSLLPGQVMTPDGFVIDADALAALDNQQREEIEGHTLPHT